MLIFSLNYFTAPSFRKPFKGPMPIPFWRWFVNYTRHQIGRMIGKKLTPRKGVLKEAFPSRLNHLHFFTIFL
ncbi:MAG: hypothetical protein CL943_00040 [Candidatus Diapherotrites archaeon]|uniref:Uncharacterized protein n=1 Tax=Candidatus Iainarchaeum sp. TaxID=3101447 RepID=A0A2D6LZT3_9ARCH|nr:hypothetical protein [Candidatus Diapherotrites archaeon]